MKSLFIALFMMSLLGCSKNHVANSIRESSTCFTGRLVKKGICGQRVVEIVSENRATLSFAPEWTDPGSGKVYRNVFTVGNLCDFPGNIEEGVTFQFSIHARPSWNCLVCQAWTATPDEKNNIDFGCGKS